MGPLGFGAGGGGGTVSAPLTLASGTITADDPALVITQTWNNGSETFTAFKVNATSTASATASMLMDLQTGGSTRFYVTRDGVLRLSTAGGATQTLTVTSGHAFQTGHGTLIGSGLLSFNGWSGITGGTGSGATLVINSNNGAITTFDRANLLISLHGSAGVALQMQEMTAPSAPATNYVKIYAEDDGGGKTRLMALFSTGAAQQIAAEP